MLIDGRLILLCQKGLQGLVGNPGWSLSTFDALNELFTAARLDHLSALIVKLSWKWFDSFHVDFRLFPSVIAAILLLPYTSCHVFSRIGLGLVLLILVEGQAE